MFPTLKHIGVLICGWNQMTFGTSVGLQCDMCVCLVQWFDLVVKFRLSQFYSCCNQVWLVGHLTHSLTFAETRSFLATLKVPQANTFRNVLGIRCGWRLSRLVIRPQGLLNSINGWNENTSTMTGCSQGPRYWTRTLCWGLNPMPDNMSDRMSEDKIWQFKCLNCMSDKIR